VSRRIERLRLFHFTSPLHWGRIREQGVIEQTDPRLNPRSAVIMELLEDPVLCKDPEAFIAHLETWDEIWGTSPHPVLPRMWVVWLTADPNPKNQTWARDIEKRDIRIVVSVPRKDAKNWPIWARQQGCPERWYESLASWGRPEDWYVVPRRIRKAEWLAVEDSSTGEVLWPPVA
jgi:hypothetical protein